MSPVEAAVELKENKTVPVDVEALFKNCHSLVLQAAFRITGSRAEAEDVLQTLFLRLLEGPSPVVFESSPSAYLRRAAINLALDQLRRRNKLAALDEAAELTAVRSSHPDEGRASSELKEALRLALARLHPKAAEIFVLHHFEGLNNRDIARLLGTSWGTVAVTLHRAHRRLRKDLKSFLGGKS